MPGGVLRQIVYDQADCEQNHGAQQDREQGIQISQPTNGVSADNRDQRRRPSRRMQGSGEMHGEKCGRHGDGTGQHDLVLLWQEQGRGHAHNR